MSDGRWGPRRAVALRDLASLKREKTIVLALLIQLFVAAFSSFLVVGLVSLYDPGSTEGSFSVEMAVSGNASDEVQAVIDRGETRTGVTYANRDAALTAFTNRQVDAVLHASYSPEDRIRVEAVAPEGDFRTTLIVVQVKEVLSTLERERRADLAYRLDREPLPVPPRPDSNPYFGFTYTILVPMLAFLPAFISGSIASDSIAEELERGTLELLRVAPLSVPEIIDGKAIAMIGIAPAQAAVWLLFLELNGTAIHHPLAILLLVTSLTAVLVVIGAALAIAIGIRREAQLLYSLLALALFGAALLLPEGPPNLVAKLAIGSPTPVTYGTVGALAVVAVAGYWAIRRFAGRRATGE